MFKKKDVKKNVMIIVGIVVAIIIVLIMLNISYTGTSSNEAAGVEKQLVTTTAPTTTVANILPVVKSTVIKYSTTTIETTVVETATTDDVVTTTEIRTSDGKDVTTTIEEVKEIDNIIFASDEKLYYYPTSHRVHRSTCLYADPGIMEELSSDYIECARKCTTCNPDIQIGTIYEDPVTAVSDNNYDPEYERNYTVNEMTYYSGPWGCYGASGRTLVNNYSVACNSIPLGTIVYIKSSDGSVNGVYRVDDTGGMGGNVIDIFYSDYSNTPYSFRQAGRVSCEVYIVE